MLISGRPIGVTGAFESTAALALEPFAPAAVARHVEAGGEEPRVGWETALVAGLLGGSFLASRLSGGRAPRGNPIRWRRRFGSRRAPRLAVAFLGGAVLMYGARAAGGCTSGHGISGTMQLAASSLLFVPIIFAAGAVTSRALYGRSP
jgi:uncharacterized protein